jgi:hypothetical protein
MKLLPGVVPEFPRVLQIAFVPVVFAEIVRLGEVPASVKPVPAVYPGIEVLLVEIPFVTWMTVDVGEESEYDGVLIVKFGAAPETDMLLLLPAEIDVVWAVELIV